MDLHTIHANDGHHFRVSGCRTPPQAAGEHVSPLVDHSPMSAFHRLTVVATALWLVIGTPAGAADDLRDDARRRFGVIVDAPAEARSAPAAELGRALFWDPRISADGRTACASCHLASAWGADPRPFSIDARGRETARNSQTVFNAMLQPSLRWTGDRRSGAHQAERSLTGSLGFSTAEEVVPVLHRHGYEASFRRAFPGDPEPVGPGNYARAIQSYQATLVTPAAFDRYLLGEDDALSPRQKEGLRTFIGSGCAGCHKGALLGGTAIRKFGIAGDYWTATGSARRDVGLFEATKVETDRYRFRVPMLRNIARTAPYFHDGSVGGLAEAVQVMAEVQLGNRLGDSEAEAVVDFLGSLTGGIPAHYGPPEGGESVPDPSQRPDRDPK